jgi:hypothetical protein
VHLSRPYYSFRPRVSIGFGIFVGVPFGYPSWYDPYRGYGAPYVGPRLARYGGISFDIQPYDAEIYVDGYRVGCVEEYSPYEGPLTLAAGRHWIELRAPGYRRLSFEITVVPGQVIPYRGSLPYGW